MKAITANPSFFQYRISFVAIAVAFMLPMYAIAQDCVDYRESLQIVGSSTLSSEATSIAAHEGVVYLIEGNRLVVRDVHDPSDIVEIGSLVLPLSSASTKLTKSGELLMAWNASGYFLVNIADSAIPELLSSTTTPVPISDGTLTNNCVFAAAGTAGVLVYDVTTPTLPIPKATIDTPGTAVGVTAIGNRLFVADSTSSLRIFDIANQPLEIGVLGGYLGLDARAVFAFDDDVILRCRVYEPPSTWTPHLFIIDVSNPAHPVASSELPFGDVCGIHGDRIFLGNGSSGDFRLIDYRDESAPHSTSTVRWPGVPTTRSVVQAGNTICAVNGTNEMLVLDAQYPDYVQPAALNAASLVQGGFGFSTRRSYSGYWSELEWTVHDLRDPRNPVALSTVSVSYEGFGGPGSIHLAGTWFDRVALVMVYMSFPTAINLFDYSGETPRQGGFGYANVIDICDARAFVGREESTLFSQGIYLYDIADVSAPVLLGHTDRYFGELIALPNYGVAARSANGLVVVYDFGNPAVPVERGSLDLEGTLVYHEGTDIFVFLNGTMYLLDLRDFDHIAVASTVDLPSSISHVTRYGNYYAFGMDEIGTQIYDYSDKTRPYAISPVFGTSGSMAWNGDTLYIESGTDGLRAYDLSNMSNPVYLGRGVDAGGNIFIEAGLLVAAGSAMPLQCGTGTVNLPYSESFDDGHARHFEPVSGTWAVIDDVYYCRNDGPDTKNISTVGETTWGDYRFECDLLVRGAPEQEFLFRYQSPGDWYLFGVLPDPYNQVVLWKSVSGEEHLLAQVENVPNDPGMWRHLAVEVEGSTIRAFFDGVQVINYEDRDRPFLTGKVAVDAFADAGVGWQEVWVDNVSVEAIGPATMVPNPRSSTFALRSYPNPFNPQTRIAFSLGAPGEVLIAVYDLRGRLVRSLLDGPLEAGDHAVEWNGQDALGRALPSGTYFCRLSTLSGVETRKLSLVR